MRGRKDIRLKQYNYKTDGYYFVTAVTQLRENIFLGQEKLVADELNDTIKKCFGVSLDFFVIMPNHVHIIFILTNSNLLLGEIVRRFKAKVSHKFGKNIWQWNYYEHIIRNDLALNKIREYILNNPHELLLEFKQFYN